MHSAGPRAVIADSVVEATDLVEATDSVVEATEAVEATDSVVEATEAVVLGVSGCAAAKPPEVNLPPTPHTGRRASAP